jgi:hypothetical protein
MNPPPAPELTARLILELHAFRRLCEEALALATQEGRTLAGPDDYLPGEFNQWRKRLLPQLDSALIQFRKLRQGRRQTVYPEEINSLFQSIQSLLMKVLLRDRENQQALLRRGLVPPLHQPPAEAQQPHFVSSLYRRHARNEGAAPG